MAEAMDTVPPPSADGKVLKMEEDFSERVDKAIPECQEKAKKGELREALDQLFNLEKLTRLASDMRSNTKIQVTIVQLCFEAKAWTELNENIVLLTKKRSLIKHAVGKMVQECCTYVDQTPDKETQLKLIDTLRTVTAGKIYVEVERARLTEKLSKMKEANGDVDAAAGLLLDLQVETFGSMDRKEKVELLLEQMRLCLAKKDFVRAQIISRKISTRFFEDTKVEVQQLKMKYYRQMIELDQNEGRYLAICRHYTAIYNTDMVKNDPPKLEEALKNVVLYVLLAPHDNEQWDALNRIKEDRNLEKIVQFKKLIKRFATEELIAWKEDIVTQYEPLLRQGTKTSPATGVFDPNTETGKKQWEEFQTRVGEHNIRMVAKYYTRITLNRMANLLDWSEEKTEEFLCQMVVSGVIGGAKIDRPSGIISFHPTRSPVETLDEWGSSLKKLMDHLNKASHLILKEEMVHKHLHGRGDGIKNGH